MEVISTRRYETSSRPQHQPPPPPPAAAPPADSHTATTTILVDPSDPDTVATVKEEEWETRKKKEITTTRQIETRVKRQVVLEDGEVVEDSGPQVTTNTTEDVEQQEHTTQERRKTGDEPKTVEWTGGSGTVVQKELNETITKSREEIEELLETEDRQHLGDISDEAYQSALRNNRGDLRVAIAESKKQHQLQEHQLPRVLKHETRSNKVVDTEKTLERSELKEDGQIVTERRTTVEHEEIKDDEAPEGLNGADEVDDGWKIHQEAHQRYSKNREEDLVDYVANGERVGREMRFVSETTEAERTGDWPSSDAPKLRGAGGSNSRLHKQHGFTTKETQTTMQTTTSRKDALTRKPLDLEEEDEARKFETSKWLESHFGSESRSSHGSLDEDFEQLHHRANASMNTSYINHVTTKSSTTRAVPPPSSGYFQGISEWSERYQSTEKQNLLETTRESSRTNGYHHSTSPEITSRNHKESSYTRTYEASPEITRNHKESSYSRTYNASPEVNGRNHKETSYTRTYGTSPDIRNHKETSYTRSYEALPENSRNHRESSYTRTYDASPEITRNHKESQSSYSRTFERQHQRHSPPIIHHIERPKNDPPSPPMRRKAREQVINTKMERSYHNETERSASPAPLRNVKIERSYQHEAERSASPMQSRNVKVERSYRQETERSASPAPLRNIKMERSYHNETERSASPAPLRNVKIERSYQQHDERSASPIVRTSKMERTYHHDERSASPIVRGSKIVERSYHHDDRSASPAVVRTSSKIVDRSYQHHDDRSASPALVRSSKMERTYHHDDRSASPIVRTSKMERSYHHDDVRSGSPAIIRNSSSSSKMERSYHHGTERSTSPVVRNSSSASKNSKKERSYHHEVERSTSPVHVVQRTWENRNRDNRNNHLRHVSRHETIEYPTANGQITRSNSRRVHSPERSRTRPGRSASPSPIRRDRNRPSKSPSPSKYKIGESFRKLVGKLRSGSSERRSKRGGSSQSQVTQTDDDSTYRQYNSVDRNVPLGADYDAQDDRPPERPPRSPRNVTVTVTNGHDSPPRMNGHNGTSRVYKTSSSSRSSETKNHVKNDQPINRYYLGEDPFGNSIYGKEKGYPKSYSSRHRTRTVEDYGSQEQPSSLGRFSKSTSRLAYESLHDQNDHHRSSQTLPRKIHTSSSTNKLNTTSSSSSNMTSRRFTNGYSSSPRLNNNYINNKDSQYGSMINIAFKNNPPKTTHFVQTTINTQPPKPERTYKSTLSRSKSFNVEIADDGTVTTPNGHPKTNGHYNSNIRSTMHLNKLDEMPTLKTPGLLASLSKSNRDLLRNGNSRNGY